MAEEHQEEQVYQDAREQDGMVTETPDDPNNARSITVSTHLLAVEKAVISFRRQLNDWGISYSQQIKILLKGKSV